jgi:hypothetical protein
VLRKFDYLTGQVVLEKRLQSPHDDHLREDGAAIAFMKGSQDIVALTGGNAVQRMEETGMVPWVWISPKT